MSTSISILTMKPTQIFQDILGTSYSRKLLFHSPNQKAPSHVSDNNFDANVVMVLSVLLCALFCSLGLHCIVRCVLKCSSLVPYEVGDNLLTNTGVKRKALKSFQTVSYSTELNLPGLDTECVICLSEFLSEECVKLLPTCYHGFHVRCIDKWLSSHSSCPTCRHCLIETCKKIAVCSQRSSLNYTQPLQDSISVQIEPLEPERWIRFF